MDFRVIFRTREGKTSPCFFVPQITMIILKIMPIIIRSNCGWVKTLHCLSNCGKFWEFTRIHLFVTGINENYSKISLLFPGKCTKIKLQVEESGTKW